MLFYHQNFSYLSTVRKNCSRDREKLLKFEAELGSINPILTYFYQLAGQICKIEGAKSKAGVFVGIVAIP